VDLENRVVFRRVKHFSGYILLGLSNMIGGGLDELF
jgi:hypothetical protein